MKIGICIIAFNRLHTLKRLLTALESANYERDSVALVISIDKSDVVSVVEYAKNFNWKFGEKRILMHQENLGLRKHILQCGDLLDEFDALIILEDDILVMPGFYLFAKQCVGNYQDDDRIAGISLYSFAVNYQNRYPFVPLKRGTYDVYFMNCAQSWGQVWMKNQWKDFRQWYERQDSEFGLLPHLPKTLCSWPKSSWLKFHTKYCIEENKYFIYPYTSFSTNFGDIGTHNRSGYALMYQTSLVDGCCLDFNLPELKDDSVKYDGFFEFKGYVTLCQRLGISETDLCVDFYGEKSNIDSYKYWLTRKITGYKVVESYSLQMRPYEMNILLQNQGTDIYLYDLSQPCSCGRKKWNALHHFLIYNYNISLFDYLKCFLRNSKCERILRNLVIRLK